MVGMPNDKGRPVLTVLPGGKGDDAELEVPQPPQTICPHCREHEVERAQAERRKITRQSGCLRVDEEARRQKATVRGGLLLD
jgi:hypothetical protein